MRCPPFYFGNLLFGFSNLLLLSWLRSCLGSHIVVVSRAGTVSWAFLGDVILQQRSQSLVLPMFLPPLEMFPEPEEKQLHCRDVHWGWHPTPSCSLDLEHLWLSVCDALCRKARIFFFFWMRGESYIYQAKRAHE